MVEYLGSGDCFDAQSHIPYVSVVRVEKKNTYSLHCMLTTIEHLQNQDKNYFQIGGLRPVRWSWIHHDKKGLYNPYITRSYD